MEIWGYCWLSRGLIRWGVGDGDCVSKVLGLLVKRFLPSVAAVWIDLICMVNAEVQVQTGDRFEHLLEIEDRTTRPSRMLLKHLAARIVCHARGRAKGSSSSPQFRWVSGLSLIGSLSRLGSGRSLWKGVEYSLTRFLNSVNDMRSEQVETFRATDKRGGLHVVRVMQRFRHVQAPGTGAVWEKSPRLLFIVDEEYEFHQEADEPLVLPGLGDLTRLPS
jgi:hypothetical protein